MILCVAANPAIDRTARVPRIVLDKIMRPDETVALAGGKGCNVARAAHLLGAQVMTVGVAGGHAGRWLIEQLEHEGLAPHFVPSDVETRTAYVVVDGAGRSVMVYEGGPPQPQRAYDDLLALIRSEMLPRASYVAIAGSVPAGVDPVWIGQVVAAAREAGVSSLADARGASLRAALAERPTVLKANETEIIDAGLGADHAQPVALARAAVRAGAGACIVTLAARGAVACSPSEAWRISVPVQRPVNTVGAGDAFTAGMVVALDRGESFEKALIRAGAAAAASVLELGAGMVDLMKVSRVEREVRVRKVVA